MNIQRIKEKGDIRLYRRARGKEKSIPLYVAYRYAEQIAEFRTITQARRFMEKASTHYPVLIYVRGGVCYQVKNLPKGYEYIVIDED